MQVTLTAPDNFEKLPQLRKQQILQDLELQVERELEDPDQDFIAVAKEAFNSDEFKQTLDVLAQNYDPDKESPNTVQL